MLLMYLQLWFVERAGKRDRKAAFEPYVPAYFQKIISTPEQNLKTDDIRERHLRGSRFGRP